MPSLNIFDSRMAQFDQREMIKMLIDASQVNMMHDPKKFTRNCFIAFSVVSCLRSNILKVYRNRNIRK